ncbi:unnamed protein product [Hydatigera taeniaeformis]|uniref:Reverse transcriptase domain-containing protein n=1 Tax=Hydatigena taeniaeformis TaxID=6205 RepID=A0A0R3X9F6_HYDTA|nr:unnamed protein product [Hydatigera taeniaeformis]
MHYEESLRLEKPNSSQILDNNVRDLSVALVVEEDLATPHLIFSSIAFGEASPVVTNPSILTSGVGTNGDLDKTPQTTYTEQRCVETHLTQGYCNADEDGVTSEKVLPKQRPWEPCNLVEVDNLIEKIANNAALINDFVLSSYDNDLIDGMLKDCLNKSQLEAASNVAIIEDPASQMLYKLECTGIV